MMKYLYSKQFTLFVRLGQSFWQRWGAEHSDLVLKRQGNVAMNRALNCTRQMAESHLGIL